MPGTNLMLEVMPFRVKAFWPSTLISPTRYRYPASTGTVTFIIFCGLLQKKIVLRRISSTLGSPMTASI